MVTFRSITIEDLRREYLERNGTLRMTPPPAAQPDAGPAPTDAELLQFGWAPGGYTFRCELCGRQHGLEPGTDTADKRASCCRPCAVEQWKAAQTEKTTTPTSPAVDGAGEPLAPSEDFAGLVRGLVAPINRSQEFWSARSALLAHGARLEGEIERLTKALALPDALTIAAEKLHKIRNDLAPTITRLEAEIERLRGELAQRDALQAQLAEAMAARAVPDELRALSDAATPGPFVWRPISTCPPDIDKAIIGGRYPNGLPWAEEAYRHPNGHWIGRKIDRPSHWMPTVPVETVPDTPGDATGSALITQQTGEKP